MPVFNNVLAGSSGQTSGGGSAPASDYNIERSLRFDISSSAYLSKTFSTNGDRQKWTFSFWMKRCKLNTKQTIFGSQGTNDSDYTEIYIDTDDKLFIRFGYLSVVEIKPARRYRDTSAWQHIVLAMNTQASGTDRFKVYNNGELIEVFTTDQRSSFSGTYGIGRAGLHKIGAAPNGSADYSDFYLADIHYVNGSQNPASDFGQYSTTTGVWGPKAFTGQHGTNGFHLDFSDATSTSTVAEDSSGNNNDWTANNFSVTSGAGNDSLIDTPTNYTPQSGNPVGNYATWSPLVAQTSGSITLSNGNLDTTCGSTRTTAMSNFPLTGKSYWEVTFGSGTYNYIGMTEATGFNTVANNNSGIKYTGYQSYSYGWGSGDGKLYKASNILASPGAFSNGDVVGWAYDADNNTLKLYKNGSLQHTETGIADAQYFPAITHSGTATASTNFGQRPFQYPVSGYNSLCSTNLPDPVVDDPETVMGISLYTGNGGTANVGASKPSENATVVGGTISNPERAFNGSSADYANLTATNTSTAAHVDFAVNLTGVTRIEAAFDSPSGSGDTRGRYNGANGGNTRSGGGSGWSDIYNGSAITVTSVGFGINQNGATGTNNDIVSRFRITDSSGTYILVDGVGTPYKFSPELAWIKWRANGSYSHNIFDAVRGATKVIYSDGGVNEGTDANSLTSFDANGFTVGSSGPVNNNGTSYAAWAWDAENLASNSAYHQTNTWSSSSSFASTTGFRSSEPETNAFDGDTATICSAVGNGVVTFTSPVTFPSSSTIKVFVHGGDHTVTVNGGSNQTVTAGSFQTITFSNPSASTFTITFQRASSADTGIRAIEIGGKLLVDAGVIPAGGLNSSLYNQSQTWSNTLTSNPSNSLGNAANVFDGSESHGRNTNMSSGATVTFTPTGTITNVTKLEVKVGAVNTANTVFELNGVNKLSDYNNLVGTGSAVTDRYVDITSLFGGSTTLTSMKWGYNGSSDYNLIRNIKVNGKLLVDSGVSLTNVPSIASTCRSNQSAGFSICSYQGNGGTDQVAHNCNATPGLILIKNLSATAHWYVYHSGLTSGKALNLNQTDGEFTPSQAGITAVSSSTFTLGSSRGETNASGNNYIAYCWAPVEGVSAMGVYTGSSGLPFVYTGFKVGFIILKRKEAAGDWIMHDTTRKPSNGTSDNNTLVANVSNGEDAYYTATQVEVDYFSNGFKLRHTGGPLNDTGSEYIWAAWASNPFKHQSRAN